MGNSGISVFKFNVVETHAIIEAVEVRDNVFTRPHDFDAIVFQVFITISVVKKIIWIIRQLNVIIPFYQPPEKTFSSWPAWPLIHKFKL